MDVSFTQNRVRIIDRPAGVPADYWCFACSPCYQVGTASLFIQHLMAKHEDVVVREDLNQLRRIATLESSYVAHVG